LLFNVAKGFHLNLNGMEKEHFDSNDILLNKILLHNVENRAYKAKDFGF